MKSSITIEQDVKRANRVGSALRNGLSKGLEEAGDYLLDKGEEAARDAVMSAGRVWNKDVKRGFQQSPPDFHRYYHWSGTIRNVAPHAEIVDKGLAPAGEITGSTPSIQDILPWIDSEVAPNAAARASAEAADLDNWDPEIRALAEEYGTAEVIAAFAIAKHIKDEGYPGVQFVEVAEAKMRNQTVNAKKKIEREMERELRRKGLK
jgi:hypothetical protein